VADVTHDTRVLNQRSCGSRSLVGSTGVIGLQNRKLELQVALRVGLFDSQVDRVDLVDAELLVVT
jgi:hypothetical protein